MAINGKYITIARSGTTIAGTIVGTRSNTISSEGEMIPVSTPASGSWQEYISGKKRWSFSANWLMLSAAGVKELLNVGTTYTITVSVGGVPQLTGTALLQKCDITATIGNLVQGNFSFVGSGALTEA